MTGENTDKYLELAVESEYDHCVTKHGNFKNHHEAYGVMKEEMEETWDAAAFFGHSAMNHFSDLWEMIKRDDMTEAEEHLKIIYSAAEELVKEGIQVMAMCRKWNYLLSKENE